MPDTPTFQDLLADFADEIFVGRNEQLLLFEKALTANTRPPFLILAVSGQGGVGKSTLLEQFRAMADNALILTTLSNEDQTDVPFVLAQFADELEQRGASFKAFHERYRRFRELKEAIEADQGAPKGILDVMLRGVTRMGLRSLRYVPIAGDAVEVLLPANAEDRIVDEMSGLAAYVAQKFKDQDDRVLLLETNQELSRCFVADLNKLMENRRIILFFDTYEKTAPFLDRWLHDFIKGKFGRFSGKVLFVIAGRYPLGQTWMDFNKAVRQVELEKFTEAEVREYLEQSGIIDEQLITQFLRLSDGLPVLLALLVSTPGDIPTDMSMTAVERFLQGTTSDQRDTALVASVPRIFNRDILAAILGDEAATPIFQWLIETHFVRSGTGGWAYHDVVRSMLLRHLRFRSIRQYTEIHNKLAEYYHSLQQTLEIPLDKRHENKMWWMYEVERLYHLLSSSPLTALVSAFTSLLYKLKSNLVGAEDIFWETPLVELFTIFSQVSQETEEAILDTWVNQLKFSVENEAITNKAVAFIEFCLSLTHIESLDAYERSMAFLFGSMEAVKTRVRSEQQAITYITKAIELSPQEIFYYVIRGLVYYQSQNYEGTIRDFTHALELEPNDKGSYYYRAQSYYELQNYEAAVQDFTRAIELEPDNVSYHIGRGQSYYQLQNHEAAVQDFTRAIELEPDNAYHYYGRGLSYHELQNYEAAVQDFTRAIELEPDNAFYYSGRGQSYYELQNYEAAVQDFTRAIELEPDNAYHYGWRGLNYYELQNYEAAVQDLTHTIELKSDDKGSYYWRGLSYHGLQNYEAAEQDFTHAIELEPDNASYYYYRSKNQYELQNYEAAVQDLTQAIKLEPDNASHYFGRGLSYYELQNYEAAEQDFTRAIELEPDDASHYVGRALNYHELQNYEAAEQDLTRAIELKPDNDSYYCRRALNYHELQNYEAAVQDFTRAIELESNNAIHYYYRGQSYQKLESHEAAVPDLTQAIELEPNNTSYYNWRARSYYELQNYAAALQDLTQAIELEPDDAYHYYLRALNYHELQNYEAAVQDFTRAIELRPDNAYHYMWRAESYYELQNYEAVVQDLTRAIELEPDNASQYTKRATGYHELQNYKVALEDLTRAIELEPDNENNYYWRAKCYHGLENYEAAVQDFTRAIELQPDDPYSYVFRAQTYIVLANFIRAKEDLARTRILLDEDGTPAFIAAQAYAFMGQVDDAYTLLRLACERDSSFAATTTTAPAFDKLRESTEFKALVAEFMK